MISSVKGMIHVVKVCGDERERMFELLNNKKTDGVIVISKKRLGGAVIYARTISNTELQKMR